MQHRIAITRAVSPAIDRCELTHLARSPIDVERAVGQHEGYIRCLRVLGCVVVQLPAEPQLPDSVFVEDTAIVLDELAVICRPGAESRRSETAAVRAAVAQYRAEIRTIESPGTLDGGDCLVIGRTLFVGISTRTNPEGTSQLESYVEPFGYKIRQVLVEGCLHLKSAVTYLGNESVLINPEWVDASKFEGLHQVSVVGSEPAAANALAVEGNVVYSDSYPATRQLLEKRGYEMHTLDMSELEKAEGGVTCGCLMFET